MISKQFKKLKLNEFIAQTKINEPMLSLDTYISNENNKKTVSISVDGENIELFTSDGNDILDNFTNLQQIHRNELSSVNLDAITHDCLVEHLKSLLLVHGASNSIPYNRFAVFSDMHITDVDIVYTYESDNNESERSIISVQSLDGGYFDYINALCALNNIGISNLYCCGDIGMKYRDSELTNFIDISEKYFNYPDRIFTCVGNHDVGYTDEYWEEQLGYEKNYLISSNNSNDIFYFMSFDTRNSVDMNGLDSPYNEGWRKLSADILPEIEGKRLFVFMHFPLNNTDSYNTKSWDWTSYPGLRDNNNKSSVDHYGFSRHSAQSKQILETLRDRNGHTIVFSGHSHIEFAAEEKYPYMNFKQVYNNLALVHVPSLNYVRDKDWNTPASSAPYRQKSQGYIVDLYDDKVILNAYEFNPNFSKSKYGKKLNDYIYEINT